MIRKIKIFLTFALHFKIEDAMQVVEIEAAKREEKGTSAARALRKEGRIPGVLYSKKNNVQFSVHPNDIKDLVYTPDFKLAHISVDGQQYKCILKDLQMHPVTDNVVHLDLQEIIDDQMIKVRLPIRLNGTSAGQKEGGILVQELRRFDLKILPRDLVEEINIDVTEMDFGDTIRVKDLELPEGAESLLSGNIPICTVVAPRSLKSLEANLETAIPVEGEEPEEGVEAAEGAETEEAGEGAED